MHSLCSVCSDRSTRVRVYAAALHRPIGPTQNQRNWDVLRETYKQSYPGKLGPTYVYSHDHARRQNNEPFNIVSKNEHCSYSSLIHTVNCYRSTWYHPLVKHILRVRPNQKLGPL